MCPGDETVTEDAQPTPDPQPTPTYDEDAGTITTGEGTEPLEDFPVVPVAVGVGALALIAALV